MLPDIPFLNAIKQSNMVMSLNDKIQDPDSQRRLVLVIVCIALFLDNMLYMVIVPIIPIYLSELKEQAAKEYAPPAPLLDMATLAPRLKSHHRIASHAWNHSNTSSSAGMQNMLFPVLPRYTGDEERDVSVGVLFASKALIQLFVSPFSGTLIDKYGYERPMIFGLSVIFLSTTIFAFGRSYGVLLIARSLQGVGSAFADTSGLAMIADRYKEEGARSKAQGIALAFISFGCLFAPPFGGFFYTYCGKAVPFILLSLVALIDGLMLMFVMKPARKEREARVEPLKGTPIYRLILDPYIAICAGALVMANVSLAFLEPTIARWMKDTMKATEFQIGAVWLPPFIPHVFGVFLTVKLVKMFPQKQWLITAIGLTLEGLSCLIIPFCSNFGLVIIPLMIDCFGIALVDTAILPTLAYLVDVRHVSIYGSVYAIADISYSLAYAFGPIVADGIYQYIGFTWLNIGICVSTLLYAPVLILLKNVYKYKPFDDDDEGNAVDRNGYQEGIALKPGDRNHPSYVLNSLEETKGGGQDGYTDIASHVQPGQQRATGMDADVNRQYVHVGRAKSFSRESSDDAVVNGEKRTYH